MNIRPLVNADIPAVTALVQTLARAYIVHESPPEGAANFLAENNEMGIRGFIARGHAYHVALVDDVVVGFIAVRDNSHLFHLFVARNFQRQGIARQLWQAAHTEAIARGGDGAFTVNSSNYAVPVYESFGFVRVGPTQFAKGLYYNPMRLVVDDLDI